MVSNMTRGVVPLIATAAVALACFAPLAESSGAAGQNEQRGTAAGADPQAAGSAGPAPRMADGHPDLTGVWWGKRISVRRVDAGALGRGGAPRHAAADLCQPLQTGDGGQSKDAQRQGRPDVALHSDGIRHVERGPLRRRRGGSNHRDAEDGGHADRDLSWIPPRPH